MPELPDITVYLEALERRTLGRTLERVDVLNPFVLRTVDPPLPSCFGTRVAGLRRLGKRIVLELGGGSDGRGVGAGHAAADAEPLFLVVHLMIAGRLHWHEKPPKLGSRLNLAAFRFAHGTLVLTEAGTKRRASLHLVRGAAALAPFDRGGLDVLAADAGAFEERLRSENHTLKRALTDPRLFSGIGNAYSDEILHRARLSPLLLTARITGEQAARLHAAVRAVLTEWTARLRAEAGDGFPAKVTAFRPEMAVHGRYRQPCPVCGAPVQRIRYADNETDYCAPCQTGGKLLADRALSRLLKGDWPRSLEELEELTDPGR